MTHPVSWLGMERYHLGELHADQRASVEGHLADCPRCQAILAKIESDQRSLPPLLVPLALPQPGAAQELIADPESMVVAGPSSWWTARRSQLATGLGLVVAIAAAALLWVGVPSSQQLPPDTVAAKGGVLAVELIRERDGVQTRRPTTFQDGDRVQVRVSCPPGDRAQIAVLQGDDLLWPLPSAVCGSRVVAGALTLTGSADTAICVLPEPAPATRGALADGACVVLRAQP